VKLYAPPLHPILTAVIVLSPYGAVFFAATLALGIPEASQAIRRFGRLQS
jgi:hypothetical protein